MFNIDLFEIIFFISFALIFLGPEKLLELLKIIYQWYQKIKFFIQNFQNDIERELRLTELQKNLESEIDKIRDLEKLLSQKIHTDIDYIYISLPYSSLEKIRLIEHDNRLTNMRIYPKSYSMINKDINKKKSILESIKIYDL